MDTSYKLITDANEDQALTYYAAKIDARAAAMKKRELASWVNKNQDFLVRNFTCRSLWRKTRFPDMLKRPEFRRAVAIKTRHAFARQGWQVDAYMWAQRHLHNQVCERVGSGYELRIKIKALPAAIESRWREVHGEDV